MTATKKGFRSQIGAVTRKVPLVHKFLVGLYHLGVFEVWPRLRSPLASARGSSSTADLDEFLSLQSIRLLKLELKAGTPGTADELVSELKRLKVPYSEGGWTIYLPPSAKLRALLPDIGQYPPDAGLKILKDFKPPQTASYTPNEMRPAPGAAAVRARTPGPRELLRIAGMLSNEGLGARVYDLAEIEIGKTRGTAFLVQHVEGGAPISAEEHQHFIDKLDRILARQVLEVAHGDHRISKDFRQPDCNGNLIRSSSGECLYVDFQSFRYRDEKKAFLDWAQQSSSKVLFGPKRLGRGQNYLYQMIPGLGSAKRGTLDRWDMLDELLRNGEVSLEGRTTYDIGCNTGLMSYYALSRGARWAYGWDMAEIAAASNELLRLLGASRWNAFGTEISAATDFKSSLPADADDKDGVLFYLAISNHIGFPSAVADLPWKYCVYEGHSNQSVDWSVQLIKEACWSEQVSILATKTIIDGDSPQRALILFSR